MFLSLSLSVSRLSSRSWKSRWFRSIWDLSFWDTECRCVIFSPWLSIRSFRAPCPDATWRSHSSNLLSVSRWSLSCLWKPLLSSRHCASSWLCEFAQAITSRSRISSNSFRCFDKSALSSVLSAAMPDCTFRCSSFHSLRLPTSLRSRAMSLANVADCSRNNCNCFSLSSSSCWSRRSISLSNSAWRHLRAASETGESEESGSS
mmetsp:Transcript_33441/g.88563  ORF Transcript_33441/g.88563 Transcript_33441/m.88563 type:complete len:204 (-) Transcript_33441:173-784(-)